MNRQSGLHEGGGTREDYSGFLRKGEENDMHLRSGDKDYYYERQLGRRLSQFDEGFTRGDLLTSSKFQWRNLLSEPKQSTSRTEMNHTTLMNHSTASSYYGNTTNATTMTTERDCHRCSKCLSSSELGEGSLERPLSVDDIGRGRSYPPYHLDGRQALLSRDLNSGIRSRPHHLDNQLGREIFNEENDFKGTSDYGMRGSPSMKDGTSGFVGSYMEAINVPSYESGLSSEMINMPFGHDGSNKCLSARYHVDPRKTQLNDMRGYSQEYISPHERRHGDYDYQERQRIGMHETSFTSDEPHGKVVVGREGYDPRELLRVNNIDPNIDRIDGSSPREQLRINRFGDHVSSQEQMNTYYFNLSESGHANDHDREVMGCRSTDLEYEETYDRASVPGREDNGYERCGGSWTYAGRSEMLPVTIYDLPCSDGVDGSFEQRLVTEDPSRAIKRKCSEHKTHICNTHYKEIEEEEWIGEDGNPSKKSRFSVSQYVDGEKLSHETVGHGIYNSQPTDTFNQVSRLDDSSGSKLRDIQHRLGPGRNSADALHSFDNRQKPPVNRRLGPGPRRAHSSDSKQKPPLNKRLGAGVQGICASHSSVHRTPVKKRLGPCPKKIQVRRPWVEAAKTRKLTSKTHEGTDHDQDGEYLKGDVPPAKACKMVVNTHEGTDGACKQERESSKGNVPPANVALAKADPPENSTEFKKKVDIAFLKFVKQVNENTGFRKRLLEPVKTDGLKCNICGSKSEEFRDTESLVIHTYKSQEVDSRSAHLGFHKALCLLMGWKSAADFNGPWVRESLPEAECLTLKENFIIWPPVIIIHNVSIQNNNPVARVIVSTEMLEGMLKDIGFGEKTKVGRGKAANHSVMIVKFDPTFTGLKEAERLHKFYADTKHGRTEFQHIGSSNISSSSDQVPKPEDVLYGYLGIAEDLDKLIFDKKRSQVRSKKEILGIAEAS